MIDTKAIASLIDIAGRAIDADACAQKRRKAHQGLRSAYHAWRTETGQWERLDAASPEMGRMRTATAEEYEILCDAQRDEANARKRLQAAIRKYQTKANG